MRNNSMHQRWYSDQEKLSSFCVMVAIISHLLSGRVHPSRADSQAAYYYWQKKPLRCPPLYSHAKLNSFVCPRSSLRQSLKRPATMQSVTMMSTRIAEVKSCLGYLWSEEKVPVYTLAEPNPSFVNHGPGNWPISPRHKTFEIGPIQVLPDAKVPS